ncbi:lipopolysaccharide transport periplasmic protein LptA [Helicobacter bilis]|uniref:Lipopolysaccharide transport periplasmic protein LptA n=1 Tax=Helicobacter bilis TaxID=37372 RepID=A0A4U8UA89_9HELI|nr:lipopolysaccharide transport periplasmic protein LptA [Helicobacter bilis]MCI7411396.1 lipopolysaccharide transport periplasmic protein LptA [Helicobacter bilis]MDD7297435.1 lipopolysaccharide transport periplasmic protein LptA [Helicobacter bilis]MDY4400281.1 lipopolysaccharide transport periplasmic protein LptA [Helicobacter bilis]TLE10016.1 lipopolysaccharide transport periplasmic protein LptA [Helicobacter bilis]TLE11826.1 lipopolysaccharide transport periplasmic protein LptA [Helicobac
MKRYYMILCIFALNLMYAAKPDVIDIVAQNFQSVGNVTTITGNVDIKKGSDRLFADKVIVYTDKARKPLKYEAIGNVRFSIITTDKRELKGKSNRLIYQVKQNEYRLYDNAFVEEIGKPNVLKGDEIVLSGSGEYANIVGKKKAPARVTFTLDKDDE